MISLHAGDAPHTIGKLSMRVTTLLQASPQLEVYTQNYAPLKSWKSQFREFRDSHLGVLGQNDIWLPSLVAKHMEYYKGEGCGFPEVWAVVSFVNLCLPVVSPCTKSATIMH